MLKLAWIYFMFLYTCADETVNSTAVDKKVTCRREHEFDRLDVRSVSGIWSAVEIYTHLDKEGVTRYETCPTFSVWETDEIPHTTTFGPSMENQLYHVQSILAKFNQQHRHLHLLWNENGHTIEYSLFFRNESAGYWETFDKQNGSVTNENYKQFSGTVQVLKAVKDHLVLSFCQAASNVAPAQLYSVLFSREPGPMPQWTINAVHNLLQNKNLSIASRRMLCTNDAGRPFLSLFFSLITCVLVYVSLS